ncbi:MAG: hypothetical protein HGA53_06265, partial [Anaerolineaceae bacterium]|nr:hypothetical protein [Anaerolineaceae bacterium]
HQNLFPLFLLVICILAYGLRLKDLGFYWDDWPFVWIAKQLGPAGVNRYFSIDRPFWGLIIQDTVPMLGVKPLVWQLFALLLRWLCGTAYWWLLRTLWPDHGRVAAWAAILLVLYPGFSQQFISVVYGHFYILLLSMLISMILMVMAIRHGKYYVPLTVLAALLSAVNLFSAEYFFLLDIARILIIFWVVSELFENKKQRWKRFFLYLTPYFLLFVSAVFWRTFIQGFQRHQPVLIQELPNATVSTLFSTIVHVLTDLWLTTIGAWIKAFQSFVTPPTQGDQRIYWAVIVFALMITFIYFWGSSTKKNPAGTKHTLQFLLLGFFWLVVAGGPFWLTGLTLKLEYFEDRYAMPFMLGSSMIFAGVLGSVRRFDLIKFLIIALSVGAAVGLQYKYSIGYAWDWSMQKYFFQQMVWRMPDLQPGTTILVNELPMKTYTDNSLTAPLNWIYDPENHTQTIQYMMYYPSVRLGLGLKSLELDQPIIQNYRAADFVGSTSKMLTIIYEPPGCLRVLDAEVEQDSWLVPDILKKTMVLNNLSVIYPEPATEKQVKLPDAIFGPELTKGWCYYYEKAELARQLQNWEQVTILGDTAFALDDRPNDPNERLPFIEGYAREHQLEKAVNLSKETQKITPVMEPLLCKLWARIIAAETFSSSEMEMIVPILSDMHCTAN